MSDNQVKFLHLRLFHEGQVLSRGGRTIAYVENTDGTLTFATAACHPRDNYSKRLGRIKAQGLLKSSSRAQTVTMSGREFQDRIDADLSKLNQLHATEAAFYGAVAPTMARKYNGKKHAATASETGLIGPDSFETAVSLS
ncbi:hypothetical protein [Xanthomonas phage JGB6]|nr:hypothetical protein [Xanthomonas phage JGB6]